MTQVDCDFYFKMFDFFADTVYKARNMEYNIGDVPYCVP